MLVLDQVAKVKGVKNEKGEVMPLSEEKKRLNYNLLVQALCIDKGYGKKHEKNQSTSKFVASRCEKLDCPHHHSSFYMILKVLFIFEREVHLFISDFITIATATAVSERPLRSLSKKWRR